MGENSFQLGKGSNPIVKCISNGVKPGQPGSIWNRESCGPVLLLQRALKFRFPSVRKMLPIFWDYEAKLSVKMSVFVYHVKEKRLRSSLLSASHAPFVYHSNLW